MRVGLVATLFGLIAAQPPHTGIECSWLNSPVDVPKDPNLYLGTWFTIAIATKAWSRNHVCTQVQITAQSGTNRTYEGATFAINQSQTTPNVNQSKATATLIAADLTTFNPPYKLLFPFPGASPDPFYIAAVDGDGTPQGITAVAFYACDGRGSNNTQLFYLSRAPYLMAPVTVKRLMSKAAKSIGNLGQIQMDAVTQAPGWCNYAFPPTGSNLANK